MTWQTNSPVWHPQYQKMCRIKTRNGEVFNAKLIHLNPQYHTRVKCLDVWTVKGHKSIKDKDVIAWEYVEA